MKHIYTLLLGLLAWSASMAQEGVNFRDITFEEALKQAKSENKLVFMDCYTSWCGPCKNMADKVFPQKAAGDYFNPRFVCVKYDMEKGAGVELAKKFEVHAYPTFLMIRPDGSMQHRLVGGDGLEAFIARVEQGFDEQNNLSALHSRYEKGGLSKSELFRYWEVLEEAGEDARAEKVYAELLALLTDEEKTQAAYWNLYETRGCTIGSPMHDFMLSPRRVACQ
ncbi:MAG: thioredoxin family protein [Odoribacter splanchnicus]